MRLLTHGAGFFVDPRKRWPVFSFEICLQFPLGFPLPLSSSSSSLVVDDGAYGKRLSFSFSCSSVVALGLAAVSYDEEVSKRIVHISCCHRNSPMQVLPIPLPSCSNLVVIEDNSVYGKSVLALIRV